MTKVRWLIMLAMLSVLGSAVAGPSIHLTFCADASVSITEAQRGNYKKQVIPVLERLKGGDRLTVCSIGSQTLNSAFAFDEEHPRLPDDPTRKERLEFQRAVLEFRRKALAAINYVLGEANSKETDIFSLFVRIHEDPARRDVMVLATDGLHSTKQLDLEKEPLAGRFDQFSRRIRTLLGWERRLSGIEVALLLPDVANGATYAPLNNRLVLGSFWKHLAETFGFTLLSFETQLPRGLL